MTGTEMALEAEVLRMRALDGDARDAAAPAFLLRMRGFVRRCVRWFEGDDVDRDDLEQVANTALWRAVMEWRPDGGRRFMCRGQIDDDKPLGFHSLTVRAELERLALRIPDAAGLDDHINPQPGRRPVLCAELEPVPCRRAGAALLRPDPAAAIRSDVPGDPRAPLCVDVVTLTGLLVDGEPPDADRDIPVARILARLGEDTLQLRADGQPGQGYSSARMRSTMAATSSLTGMNPAVAKNATASRLRSGSHAGSVTTLCSTRARRKKDQATAATASPAGGTSPVRSTASPSRSQRASQASADLLALSLRRPSRVMMPSAGRGRDGP